MYVQRIILIVFILFAVANIISIKKSSKLGEHLTKPLLIPLLIFLYLWSVDTPSWPIVLALTFGFLGDVLLMGKENFFIPGLLSFLIGHIFYIAEFTKTLTLSKISYSFLPFIVPYLLLGILIYKGLSPYLKALKPYAILYLAAILMMSFTSLLRILTIDGYQVWLTFFGSISFITSDSMLAFSIFKPDSKNKRTCIMFTYILAQFLIVSSFIW